MKTYTINDVAVMTGFTTRTLRNYLKTGILTGKKENDVWQFTEDEFNNFISNPNISKGLSSKGNAQVYDFLINDKKEKNQVCIILDLYNGDDVEKIYDFFCSHINTNDMEKAAFTLTKNGQHTRVILHGEEAVISGIMKDYYGW